MSKQELLTVINSNSYNIERVLSSMYHNKAFIVSNGSDIKKVFKTKRGAEGYINKNKGYSYYDDYFQELVFPYDNLEVIEVFDTEIIDISNNKMFWYKQLKNNMYNVKNNYCNIEQEAENANVNDELLQYIRESINDIKNDRGLTVYEEVEEVKEIEVVEESAGEVKETKDTKQNELNVDVKFNEEKNGIELYFNGKPSEEIRDQLKANKFRWAKYNKCWYSKDNEESRVFLQELGLLNEEGTQENNTINTTELKEIEYPAIDINDIESYTVSKELSDRENNNSMFRANYTDHNKEIQNRMAQANNEIVEALEGNKSPYIEYRAKTFLQSWKKKSYDLYIRMLTHKANNPSWAVTGRGNLNVNRYNKKLSQYDNMLQQYVELEERFNNEISKIKNKIYRQGQEEEKAKINSIVNSEVSLPKFEKKVVKYNVSAVDNIFNNPNSEVRANCYQGYIIFKNWACWRCYNEAGEEVFQTNTTGTLEEAKKILIYRLREQKAV